MSDLAGEKYDREREEEMRILSARRHALRFLAKQHDIDPDDASTTAGEDLAEMLEAETCPRFAVLTAGGEYRYLKLRDTFEAAKEQACAYTLDSYSEAPGLIVDLDTAQVFEPKWSSLEWLRIA